VEVEVERLAGEEILISLALGLAAAQFRVPFGDAAVACPQPAEAAIRLLDGNSRFDPKRSSQ
jgi:hypothetical protein